MLTVKICGVRRVEDARLVADAGADEIGLLVGQRHASGDFIPVDRAAAIAMAMSGRVRPVLVTHVADPDAVHALARAIGVTDIQIHSEMPPAGLARLRELGGYRLRKSWHVTGPVHLDYGEAYRAVADAFLLDSMDTVTGQVGGTGRVHDWTISRDIVTHFTGVPVILAGGLNPENVHDAVQTVRPAGVDVNSGTKGIDGFKDATRVREFVRAAKTA